MRDYRKDFAPQDGRVWLNAASEGPLPLAAAQALQEAVTWKSKPYLLDIPKFIAVVRDLKESIGKLIGVPGKDVILSNSASYGLHLLANGLPWKEGDEILLMQNDFPTDILPWLALAQKGVRVRQLKPAGKVLEPGELDPHLTDKTRLVCLSHVHTFSGWTLDIQAFGKLCREKGILFVVNVSQSSGTLPLDFSALPADAVVCAGYKWLCGPYGTGFCWMKPEVRERLTLNQAYWSAMLSEQDLKSEGELALKDIKTARRYDVFGTANFFNFVPFRAAVDYWVDAGPANVRAYHDQLIDFFIKGLEGLPFECVSPKTGPRRSSLTVFSYKDRARNEAIWRALASQGIHTALWKGDIRVSAHVYNTQEDILRLLKALKEM